MNKPVPVAVEEDVFYPDSDGQPLGETPLHFQNISYLVEMLKGWFADDPMTYVAGDMFVYYVHGDPLKHVSPDIFVARGIPRDVTPPRRRYLLWQNKPLDLVIEATSESTRKEDTGPKFLLYQDWLRVPEYFLFDPYGEYLDPPLIGYQMVGRQYALIQPVQGRLPSKVLGLHLEAHGELLRLYNPATQQWIPTPAEDRIGRLQEHQARVEAERLAQQEREARERQEAESERLRREIEELRRQLGQQPPPSS